MCWAWSQVACAFRRAFVAEVIDGARLLVQNGRHAVLHGAVLRYVDLHGADLTGADLAGADPRGLVCRVCGLAHTLPVPGADDGDLEVAHGVLELGTVTILGPDPDDECP